MKALVCKNCGATGIAIRNGYVTCEYCDSKYLFSVEDYDFYNTTSPSVSSNNSVGISIGSDIEMLLQKCRLNPRNAKKYANLILDIDPDNKEALKYL